MCDTVGFVRYCADMGMVCTCTHHRYGVCRYGYGVENPDPQYTHDKPYTFDLIPLVNPNNPPQESVHVLEVVLPQCEAHREED